MYSSNNDSSNEIQDWLDDFLKEEEERVEEKEPLEEDKSLFNITEEQVEDPNFWINL